MIRNKMEMSAVIKSLNELEKLKLLLFDKHQYYIFDHIPKPFLIDAQAAGGDEEAEADEPGLEKKETDKTEDGGEKNGKNDKIIFSDTTFWKNEETLDQKISKFSEALNEIKMRNEGEDKNPIDVRLLEIMSDFKTD